MMPEACAGTIVWDDEAREPREPSAETPVNAAKFTMVRDCARRRFRDALIGTYKCLILGANSAVSDFRDKLLHGCTGPRYNLPGRGACESLNRFRCAERLEDGRRPGSNPLYRRVI